MFSWNELKYYFYKNDNAVFRLISINIILFIVTFIFSKIPSNTTQQIVYSLQLPADILNFSKQPWSIFSYMFLHSRVNILHLIFNMIWLYFIGNILLTFLGNRHLYYIYIFGGLLGGVLFLLIYNTIPHFALKNNHYMIGASGGIMSVMTAVACIAPYYQLKLFGVFPLQLRWLAFILILLNILGLGDGNNEGGKLAHLGGAIFGYLYIKFLRNNSSFFNYKKFKNNFSKNNSNSKSSTMVNDVLNYAKFAQKNDEITQEEIDAILDKISLSGYDSLSNREKDILFNASQKK